MIVGLSRSEAARSHKPRLQAKFVQSFVHIVTIRLLPCRTKDRNLPRRCQILLQLLQVNRDAQNFVLQFLNALVRHLESPFPFAMVARVRTAPRDERPYSRTAP